MVVRILFVDDSWEELEKLKRLTRHKRDLWDMHFACGAKDAMRHLAPENPPPDVVVCEAALGDTGGIAMLETVQQHAPESIRILVSKDASTATICRSVPWAHQYLPKPLDLAKLEAAIVYVRVHPTLHESHAITALASSTDTLPALPATYNRVVEIASGRDFSLNQIAEAIQDDVALTTETLKLVNSSFFGLQANVDSIEQAVSLLGFDVMRGLVLANSLFDSEQVSATWLDLAALATRSQAVAAMARSIAKQDGHANRDQALSFLSGMVHGTGLLLLSQSKSVNLPTGAALEAITDLSVDRKVFGIDRYALGAYLLRIWAFEPVIVNAVAGLGAPVGTIVSPAARSLRTAADLVAWGGFSVTAFVSGDPDTLVLVAAMREQLNTLAQASVADAA